MEEIIWGQGKVYLFLEECLLLAKMLMEKIDKIMYNCSKGQIAGAKLPFGEIYSIEEALKQSERSPFKPNWFVFGRDKYFSFWLCSFIEDEEGLSFTYWDHESGNEIDGAVWSDIVSFLEEIQSNYEDYINER